MIFENLVCDESNVDSGQKRQTSLLHTMESLILAQDERWRRA